MTEMIFFLGKPRPRRRPAAPASITESTRLRALLARTADEVQAYAIELRHEVDQRIISGEDDDEHR